MTGYAVSSRQLGGVVPLLPRRVDSVGDASMDRWIVETLAGRLFRLPRRCI